MTGAEPITLKPKLPFFLLMAIVREELRLESALNTCTGPYDKNPTIIIDLQLVACTMYAATLDERCNLYLQ